MQATADLDRAARRECLRLCATALKHCAARGLHPLSLAGRLGFIVANDRYDEEREKLARGIKWDQATEKQRREYLRKVVQLTLAASSWTDDDQTKGAGTMKGGKR
jgi:hypothetical protein